MSSLSEISQEYGVGAIIVFFYESVLEQTAREYMRSLGLQPGMWAELFHNLVVYVPVGEEREWIDRLLRRESLFIRTASLNSFIKK